MVTTRVPVTVPLFEELPSRAVISTEAGVALGFTITSVERKPLLAEDFKSKFHAADAHAIFNAGVVR